MVRLSGDGPESFWCNFCSSREAAPGESLCEQCRLLRPRYMDPAAHDRRLEVVRFDVPAMKGIPPRWSAFEYVLIGVMLVGAMVLLASGL